MTCNRCGREATYGYVFGLCIVCDDYLRETNERHTTQTVDTEQTTL